LQASAFTCAETSEKFILSIDGSRFGTIRINAKIIDIFSVVR